MYRTSVRDFVEKEWALRSAQLDTLEGKRKALQAQIFRLRLTKYPKTLFKALTNLIPIEQLSICGILAIAPVDPPVATVNSKRHHLLALKVFLVSTYIKNRKAIEDGIKKVTCKPPLSKFGINAEITVLTLQELRNLQPRFCVSDDEPLWLYKRGMTHKYHGRTTLRRWVEDIQSRNNKVKGRACLPTIASNVHVVQEIERTWYPKAPHVVSKDSQKNDDPLIETANCLWPGSSVSKQRVIKES